METMSQGDAPLALNGPSGEAITTQISLDAAVLLCRRLVSLIPYIIYDADAPELSSGSPIRRPAETTEIAQLPATPPIDSE